MSDPTTPLAPTSTTVGALLLFALQTQGFDGLYDASGTDEDGCGCDLDDLAPCSNDYDYIAHNCRGGYRALIGDGEGIVPVKPVTLADLEALGQQRLFPTDPAEVPHVPA